MAEDDLTSAGEPSPYADPYGRNTVTDQFPRCWRCNRLLAKTVSRPWLIDCQRCKAQNQRD